MRTPLGGVDGEGGRPVPPPMGMSGFFRSLGSEMKKDLGF